MTTDINHPRPPAVWEADLISAEERVVAAARGLLAALCDPALADQAWAVEVAAETLVALAGPEVAAAIGGVITTASRTTGTPTGARLYAAALLTGGHRTQGRYPAARILEHLAVHQAAQALLDALPVSTRGDERGAA
jgi:hypothetical protein